MMVTFIFIYNFKDINYCYLFDLFLSQGFKYLYLTPDDYGKLAGQNSVEAELIEDEGEPRYKLTDIIGNNNIIIDYNI